MLKQKKRVLYICKNNLGVTILESLISLSILLLLTNMMVVILYAITPIAKSIDNNESYEFFVFFEEIQREMYGAQSVEFTSSSLILIFPDRTVSYSQYTDYVRRRVNETGHEKVLQHVTDFKIRIVDHQLQCEVTFKNGRRLSKKWYTFHELEMNIK